ncbi:hypothetical protein [Chryseobacterium kwangjuense]|uniref:Phage tail collar domain-containing protein n=1 Tax=Chryseobacterium kwangjuense TaxID=267125 RepID=A0A135W2G1_9FLAO|nr:hypothetical protein [Chryseobacterium kwangjuense]KXH79095.1 hypothetical protein AU378_20790 [Chryseobacterium kwangjuense]
MKRIHTIITLAITLFGGNILNGQVGINTSDPNQQSLLELYSTNTGFLPPRLALVSITSAAPLSQHVKGMMVYNITNNGAISEGLYVSNGTEWLCLSTAGIPVGHVKYGVQTSDHNGWYLLNGRAVSSLPSSAQSNAVSIGFATNIPDANNKYLKAKTGAEVLGASGGNTTFSLVQANLPSMTFNGTALTAGSHTHTYTDRGDTTYNAGTNGGVNNQADNTSGTYTTGSAGSHTHTFSVGTGGTNTPVSINPKNIALNIFVYLGQ